MAAGLRYDPYSQPREFMDDIIGQMKETFAERIGELKQEVAAKLAEVDAAIAALSDAKAQRDRMVRMECLKLASAMAGGADARQAARMADNLTDFVLAGAKLGAEG